MYVYLDSYQYTIGIMNTNKCILKFISFSLILSISSGSYRNEVVDTASFWPHVTSLSADNLTISKAGPTDNQHKLLSFHLGSLRHSSRGPVCGEKTCWNQLSGAIPQNISNATLSPDNGDSEILFLCALGVKMVSEGHVICDG